MAKSKIKKKHARQHPNQTQMKIVTSQTCMACQQQCARGLAYLEKMAEPGAIGFGVPCILTKRQAQTRS
ncbi:hypothetical protein ACAF76_009765 [Brevibacillus sp. TJ4]|uniref:hypothetical protein n=1 Tax=Brevibacillus sp. TJ4 TaxID=3234853 RepID=UPI003BA2CEC5